MQVQMRYKKFCCYGSTVLINNFVNGVTFTRVKMLL